MSGMTVTAAAAAAAADVMRAAKKDEVFMVHLREQVFDVAARVLGTSRAMHRQSELDAAADVAYLLLTSVIPQAQTLGEEYCDIAVSPGTTPRSRLLSALLSAVVPYALGGFLPRAVTAMTAMGSTKAASDPRAAWAAANVKEVASRVQQAHTALFLLDGRFYELSKRVLGIGHRSTVASATTAARTNASKGTQSSYNVLGGFMALRVALALSKMCRDFQDSVAAAKKQLSAQQATASPASSSAASAGESGETIVGDESPRQTATGSPPPVCTLCLDPRQLPAATPCGHVFCWDCLAHALSAKEECPLCRKPVKPSAIIRIYNMA